jgi:glucose-1-phosphate cytidylyltransferase
MKVIILAGGFGTRLSEYTESIPKPMVPIGNKPILLHIMKIYAYYGHRDFFLALGYKSDLVKEYFLNYRILNSDFSINLENGELHPEEVENLNWNVTLTNTGLNTMTGGRVKRLQSKIGNEPFLLTYGDGVADIDIDKLLEFHKSHGKLVTITAVRPVARFGELEIDGDQITSFREKPTGQTSEGWINGGFFIIEPEFFDLIDGDSTILERKPLEVAADLGELMAYKHYGFWQCMDTKRDKDSLEDLIKKGTAPWVFE